MNAIAVIGLLIMLFMGVDILIAAICDKCIKGGM